MRQIISTITPEQYALIAARVEGALVVQGGPGTGKTAVGLHRAAWLLYADPALARAGVLIVGPNKTFIAYIAQVLPALGEQSVEQRPIDSLVSVRPLARAEEEERATLLGSGRWRCCSNGSCGGGSGRRPSRSRMTVARVALEIGPDEVGELLDEARASRRTYQAGRERFRDRLADRLATRGARGLARSRVTGGGRLRGAAVEGVAEARDGGLAAPDARAARRGAVQEPQAAHRGGGRPAHGGGDRPPARVDPARQERRR